MVEEAQRERNLGEAARRSEPGAACAHYERAVALLRQCDRPLLLAHTVRHLGDVYCENGRRELAEPCYVEALAIYRAHPERSPLDLANAIRSMAVLRFDEARVLWQEAGSLYAALGIDAGVAECARRVSRLDGPHPA